MITLKEQRFNKKASAAEARLGKARKWKRRLKKLAGGGLSSKEGDTAAALPLKEAQGASEVTLGNLASDEGEGQGQPEAGS